MEGGTAPHVTASSVIHILWPSIREEGAESTNWIGASRGSTFGLDVMAALQQRLLDTQPSPFLSQTPTPCNLLALQCGRWYLPQSKQCGMVFCNGKVWPRWNVDHSPASRAKFKHDWRYTSPLYLHGVDKDSCTFFSFKVKKCTMHREQQRRKMRRTDYRITSSWALWIMPSEVPIQN